MAINKVGSKGIEDNSVAAVDFAPGTITSVKLADGTVTNAKLSNSSLTASGTSVALGASINLNNFFIDWQSKITSDGSTVTTMVAGKGYFVDNSSAAGIVKLPAAASIGDFVVIKDYAGNFGTNNLTIQRNSHNIQGVANDSVISTNRASLVLVYVDATKGWLYTDEHNVGDLGAPLHTEATGGTVTESGNFKIHTFTGDGNFVVSQLGNSPVVPTGGPSNVDYLVVAGGGGGDNGNSNRAAAGGGGAGGYRTSFPSPSCNAGAFPIAVQTYPITVGAGGAGGVAVRGSDSIFSTITSTGGGHGFGGDNLSGGGYGGAPGGGPGGSGGGGDYHPTGAAGNGNTPPVSPPQGNPGGNGNFGPAPEGPPSTYPAGGGGGASAAGGDGPAPGSPVIGGAGGAGAPNAITGSAVSYAGGGGGGVGRAATDTHPNPDVTGTAGPGGAGGGGNGSTGGTGTDAGSGTANTGGGGGGGSAGNQPSPLKQGGSGGKGIVIIRYKFQ